MKRRGFFLLLLVPAWCVAGEPRDAAVLVDAIAARQDPRVAAVVARIEGIDRRLLALRAYLRAGTGLAERWSWTAQQIAAFAQSPENRAMQAEIGKVRQAFIAANPGFDLWVNPEARSIETQLANWNGNASVARAAGSVRSAFTQWLDSVATRALPAAELPRAAEKFLAGVVPTPIPNLAAPGLSPHGQMRAVDFHIRQGDRTVAGPQSAMIEPVWEGQGWAAKLKAAVRAGSDRFSGPLESPREPWHYTYSPAPDRQQRP